ncbi:MAG: phosphomannomutase [Halobacteria archaeon]
MFGTSGVRGDLEKVSPELLQGVGRATGKLSSKDRVMVGRDGRLTSESLSRAVVSGVQASGTDVVDLGVVPTHVLAFAARELEGWGLMVTASHNPRIDNGVKVFRETGEEAGPQAEALIEENVRDPKTAVTREWGGVEERKVLSQYLNEAEGYVREFFDGELASRGYGSHTRSDSPKVAVDCGNGVGSLTTLPLLEMTGCKVIGFNDNVDGYFPGRRSKPTENSLTDFKRFVRRRDFDFGFAHDGDVDRIVVVDSDGELVHEDAVLAAIARRAVSQSSVDEPRVLTTPNTSSSIDRVVEEHGGYVERAPLGGLARNLTPDTVLAAEPWKHMFPEFGGWIDGSVSAVVLSGMLANHGVEDLFSGLRDIDVSKTNVDCPEEFKEDLVLEAGSRLRTEFTDAEVSTDYGVRLDYPNGDWVLVRPSGTEPLMRIYVEGRQELEYEAVELVGQALEDLFD